MPTKTSREIAELIGGEVIGDGELVISGVASLVEALASDLSFFGNDKYRRAFEKSAAGAVIVPSREPVPESLPPKTAWIRCEDPVKAFARIADFFQVPPPSYAPGIHPSAVVADSATIAESAHIGPCCVVMDNASVGENSVLTAGVYLGHESSIGNDCLIYQNVTIRERCQIANRVALHPGVVIGGDGFGYESGPTGHAKIPQYGVVQIDDDVEIGANTAVDRARFGRTWIKQGVKIDNLVQVAHNVVIGEHSIIVGQAGISGSVTIGQGCVLAGKAGVVGHVTLGDGVVVAAYSGAVKDIPAGTQVAGFPGTDKKDYVRRLNAGKAAMKNRNEIKELKQQLAQLEKRLDASE